MNIISGAAMPGGPWILPEEFEHPNWFTLQSASSQQILEGRGLPSFPQYSGYGAARMERPAAMRRSAARRRFVQSHPRTPEEFRQELNQAEQMLANMGYSITSREIGHFYGDSAGNQIEYYSQVGPYGFHMAKEFYKPDGGYYSTVFWDVLDRNVREYAESHPQTQATPSRRGALRGLGAAAPRSATRSRRPTTPTRRGSYTHPPTFENAKRQLESELRSRGWTQFREEVDPYESPRGPGEDHYFYVRGPDQEYQYAWYQTQPPGGPTPYGFSGHVEFSILRVADAPAQRSRTHLPQRKVPMRGLGRNISCAQTMGGELQCSYTEAPRGRVRQSMLMGLGAGPRANSRRLPWSAFRGEVVLP